MARSSNTLVLAGVPRVDLMPRVEQHRREGAALWRVWGWAMVAALAVVALVTAGAFWLQYSATQSLAAENARTTQLLGELSSLSEVSQSLAARDGLESFRASAMASDLPWNKTVTSLLAVLPSGVTLTGFDLTAGGVPQGKDPATQVGLTGTMTMTSSTPIEIAPAVRQMRTVAGVMEVDGQDVTSSGSGASESRQYTYQITVTMNQSVYSGQYATEASK